MNNRVKKFLAGGPSSHILPASPDYLLDTVTITGTPDRNFGAFSGPSYYRGANDTRFSNSNSRLWDVPGVGRELARSTTLAAQPLTPSKTSPVGLTNSKMNPTTFGQMPSLSPQELAAVGAVQIPNPSMSNVDLLGTNFSLNTGAVPYNVSQNFAKYGLNLTPAQVDALRKAGTNIVVTPGGNFTGAVSHEVGHYDTHNEEKNRSNQATSLSGTPSGTWAKAVDAVFKGKGGSDLQNAAFPRVGTPSYGNVSRAFDALNRGVQTMDLSPTKIVSPRPVSSSRTGKAEGGKINTKNSGKKPEAKKVHTKSKSPMKSKPTKMCGGGMKGYVKGGSVRGGGCEIKGKTKGRFR